MHSNPSPTAKSTPKRWVRADRPRERAAQATFHSLFNGFLHELARYEIVDSDGTPVSSTEGESVHVRFDEQGVDCYVPLQHRSPTERHVFDGPGMFVTAAGESDRLDYRTLVAFVVEELSATRGEGSGAEALRERIDRSCRNIARTVAARRDETDALYAPDTSFRNAEQSLVFGHFRHPAPKSRQGIPERRASRYVPELEGSFSLHYFAVDASLVTQASARECSASEWIERELESDPTVPDSIVDECADGAVLVPVHPSEAAYLRDCPIIDERRGDEITYLGAVGRTFYPTSSVRTVYAPDASFMVKTSLHVTITNSQRVNRRRELERGVAVAELARAGLEDEIRERFDYFEFVHDPAYVAVDLGGDDLGFQTSLRENPFPLGDQRVATPIVALCQDHVGAGPSRLRRVIEGIAGQVDRSLGAVSREWFREFLTVVVRPVVWLYLVHGVGIEAHQQNAILVLEDGRPVGLRYRDNQGYYLGTSHREHLSTFLPDIANRTGAVCSNEVADERLQYYLFLNTVFGTINAFGVADLVDERLLIDDLREELDRLKRYDHSESSLLDALLTESFLPRQSSLLTLYYDVDELTDSIQDRLYVSVDNPIAVHS